MVSPCIGCVFPFCFLLLLRAGLREEERTSIAGFLSGLNMEVRDKVELFPYRDLDELVQLCIRVEQLTIVEKILRSMTAKFDYVVCSIEESNNVITMTIDQLQSSLMVHEQRMKGHKEEEQVLKITNAGRTGGKGRGRGRGGRGRGRQFFNK